MERNATPRHRYNGPAPEGRATCRISNNCSIASTITDVVNRYATGLDRRDWPLLRSIFTDEIDMEYTSVGIKPGRYSADRWVRNSEVLFAGFGPTQHTLTNHVDRHRTATRRIA